MVRAKRPPEVGFFNDDPASQVLCLGHKLCVLIVDFNNNIFAAGFLAASNLYRIVDVTCRAFDGRFNGYVVDVGGRLHL